ncbi:MAG: porphobilinogen synthase [Oligoflexia bacterium]|nr:porphobilinogen synthase [Oligoflexia bacterium]
MKRLQRIRNSQIMRDMLAENGFSRAQLIQPLFAVEGIKDKEEVPSLKENYRHTSESVLKQIEDDLESGVRSFLLFVVPSAKSESHFDLTFHTNTISNIKKRFGAEINLWIDTCLCSFTASGHCCIFHQTGQADLESTLGELGALALSSAQAGADGISPSDMTDGRTGHLRAVLDKSGYGTVPIMSYSTKFASSFYGPFRVAADCAPQFGDRKQYQIDPRNRSDALASSVRCAEEGADLLMVKPGITSIDLIRPIHELTMRPVGAYQVSGEYGSLCTMAEKGLMNFDAALVETWHVFRRAGAAYIITYGARSAKRLGF